MKQQSAHPATGTKMREIVFKSLITKGKTVRQIVCRINESRPLTNITKQSVQSYLESLQREGRVKRSTKPDETGAWKWRKV